MFTSYSSSTGNAALDSLLTRGGMSSMLNTVWLIICAMEFGSVMEQTQLLQRILSAILYSVRLVTGLIITTGFTCIGTNAMTADQYIALCYWAICTNLNTRVLVWRRKTYHAL